MNSKTENFCTTISDLNVESNDSKIRVIDVSELKFVAGGYMWGMFIGSTNPQAVMGAPLFGSTYTQTQIAGQ